MANDPLDDIRGKLPQSRAGLRLYRAQPCSPLASGACLWSIVARLQGVFYQGERGDGRHA